MVLGCDRGLLPGFLRDWYRVCLDCGLQGFRHLVGLGSRFGEHFPDPVAQGLGFDSRNC